MTDYSWRNKGNKNIPSLYQLFSSPSDIIAQYPNKLSLYFKSYLFNCSQGSDCLSCRVQQTPADDGGLNSETSLKKYTKVYQWVSNGRDWNQYVYSKQNGLLNDKEAYITGETMLAVAVYLTED